MSKLVKVLIFPAITYTLTWTGLGLEMLSGKSLGVEEKSLGYYYLNEASAYLNDLFGGDFNSWSFVKLLNPGSAESIIKTALDVTDKYKDFYKIKYYQEKTINGTTVGEWIPYPWNGFNSFDDVQKKIEELQTAGFKICDVTDYDKNKESTEGQLLIKPNNLGDCSKEDSGKPKPEEQKKKKEEPKPEEPQSTVTLTNSLEDVVDYVSKNYPGDSDLSAGLADTSKYVWITAFTFNRVYCAYNDNNKVYTCFFYNTNDKKVYTTKVIPINGVYDTTPKNKFPSDDIKVTSQDVILAKVGINALIDEATGYQEVRKPDALVKDSGLPSAPEKSL